MTSRCVPALLFECDPCDTACLKISNNSWILRTLHDDDAADDDDDDDDDDNDDEDNDGDDDDAGGG